MMNVDQFLTNKGYDLESVGLSELKELFEAYASSRLAEVTAQLQTEQMNYREEIKLRQTATKLFDEARNALFAEAQANATLRAELERAQGFINKIDDGKFFYRVRYSH
jgi:hypothetical protein